jgi:hypothetical protein
MVVLNLQDRPWVGRTCTSIPVLELDATGEVPDHLFVQGKALLWLLGLSIDNCLRLPLNH